VGLDRYFNKFVGESSHYDITAVLSGDVDHSYVEIPTGSNPLWDDYQAALDATKTHMEANLPAAKKVSELFGPAPINGTPGDDNPLTGTSGNDTIFGLAGNDFISGMLGADTITGGDGRDVFNYTVDNDTTSSTPDNDSTTAAYDTIKDFAMMSASYTGAAGNDTVAEIVDGTDGGAAADVIDITLADTGGTASTLAVAGASGTAGTTATSNVEVSSTGLVTFAAADDTLAEKLVAIAADVTDVADGEAAVFTDGDDSYLFVNDGADDLLVKLEGITVVGLDMMANTGTIGGDDYVLIV
jgi:hypothetical protein